MEMGRVERCPGGVPYKKLAPSDAQTRFLLIARPSHGALVGAGALLVVCRGR